MWFLNRVNGHECHHLDHISVCGGVLKAFTRGAPSLQNSPSCKTGTAHPLTLSPLCTCWAADATSCLCPGRPPTASCRWNHTTWSFPRHSVLRARPRGPISEFPPSFSRLPTPYSCRPSPVDGHPVRFHPAALLSNVPSVTVIVLRLNFSRSSFCHRCHALGVVAKNCA